MSREVEGMPSTPIADVPDWTYWVVPGKFLAGCFPGAQQPAQQEERLRQLLDAGVRVFVSLMEPNERNHEGQPFADYMPDVHRLMEPREERARFLRFPIRDEKIPTAAEMEVILEQIDAALPDGVVYLHCWGGVGRTGTVAACWLLRRGLADASTVLGVLKEKRKMDRKRGHRDSPETPIQRWFVEQWAARQG